ncbi:MAG: hypothetical protein PWP72_1106 [Thermoanaerobacter sp.]|jgi:hypothetical protein|nr:hypothetical protein [Thermoanaerobacter sp.]
MAFYHRLRYQIMLLTIVLAVVPLLATSYFMIRQASRGILQEKEWWLFGVARDGRRICERVIRTGSTQKFTFNCLFRTRCP